MSKFADLTGQKFGRLEVKSFYGRIKRSYYWNCLCDCGNFKKVRGGGLKAGTTKSCGCLQKEQLVARTFKHGLSGSLLESVRSSIIQRCTNVSASNYENYGARGICVCDDWLNNPKSFFDWALNSGYQEGLTIERKDNNGSYSPDNCRWATMEEQANNRRNTSYLTYKGETKTVADWSRFLNINYQTFRKRIRSNWSDDRLFTEQVHKEKSRR